MKTKELDIVMGQKNGHEKIIALAGNPNVGKSTIFNALTGLNHHTGNWPGKTVTNASGSFEYHGSEYILADLPGCYSLLAHSAEEEVARDFICFADVDVVVVVCDATCLERNLNLVLQTIEITENVVVCVNLSDEARKKGIKINEAELSAILGVPVVCTEARSSKGLDKLLYEVAGAVNTHKDTIKVRYADYIETAVEQLEEMLQDVGDIDINTRWLALRIIEDDPNLMCRIEEEYPFIKNDNIQNRIKIIKNSISSAGISEQKLSDDIIKGIIFCAESICSTVVELRDKAYSQRDRRIDKILTGRYTAFPIMILLLGIIFWITIKGANYPSQILNSAMLYAEQKLIELMNMISAPEWLCSAMVYGVFRVLGWVVSVMLPPMAIFFPFFTLLEDLGYLPRVAFNLDNCFKKCHTCGKQALTMSMGFGCNAVGVTGCRIIDSPRERLIAILTNSFVPCNGKFPTIISIITIFFALSASGAVDAAISVVSLLVVIFLGVGATFLTSRILSKTVLKGKPSSFTLELPPYRAPLVGKVIVRSILDRTLFVLGRAVAVAAPAGLVIWIMANTFVGDVSILVHCSELLDPFARFIGLDGVILLGFILGLPANEIVLPIVVMTYLSGNTIKDINDIAQLRTILIDNGWTWITGACTIIFSLFHWPCSTTLITIKKETHSIIYTALAFILPTCIGIVLCAFIANIARFIL